MSLSADKRHRQSVKRRQRNRSLRSEMRTGVRQFVRAVENGDKENAQSLFRSAQKEIDDAARRGAIPKQRAARKKSRLQKKLNAILG